MTQLSGDAGKKDPDISIVLVGFGAPAALRACLESIRVAKGVDFRVLLIDNSNSDALERDFSREPGLEYRRTGMNLGFSRGCNMGIARSLALGSAYTLLLNPDTVLDPECLEELLRTARAFPEAGIVGGRIHYQSEPGRIWYAGGDLDYATGVGKHRTIDAGKVVETSYVTGCCMLIPNAVLKKVGGLKESIFMYLDDAEFCMRVRRAGFRLYYAPRARLGHAVGPGLDWKRYPDYYLYFSVRNRPLVADGGPYKAYLHLVALAVAGGKALMYALTPGVPSRSLKLRALAWGAWDSLSNEARQERRLPGLFQGYQRPKSRS